MVENIAKIDPRPGLPLSFVQGEQNPSFKSHSDDHAVLFQNHDELLSAIVSCSPYLARLIKHHPEWVKYVLSAEVSTAIEKIINFASETLELGTDDNKNDEQKRIFRCAKDYAALTIAIHDLGMRCSVMDAAHQLSIFADHMVQTSLSIAIENAVAKGNLKGGDEGKPVYSTGLTIIAMGKHGAHELNYSSDIDLIALYDPSLMSVNNEGEEKKTAISIIQNMVDLLSDQTGDGYVFRTDLRLRPDPGASNIVISVVAAEQYYEAHGQNWERAAYIKARAIAGDIKLGEQFLEQLRPFIWRKYLDFAAIDDIEKIRAKIQAQQKLQKNSNEDGLGGFDIKLGAGGIRQIEFFAQTRQLISGGKVPSLRARDTLSALQSLENAKLISANDRAELSYAYVALRFYEHRLQMLHDEQTHKVPRDREEQERLARFCGFKTTQDFCVAVNAIRARVFAVEDRSAADVPRRNGNFAIAEYQDEVDVSLSSRLDFTGFDDDGENSEILAKLGFNDTQKIRLLVNSWFDGSYRSTRSERSRSLIDRFLPKLFTALSLASDPDEAFIVFDRFLAGLPSGVQIFSLLANNPTIFEDLVDILITSPKLAKELTRQQGFLEVLIDGGWLAMGPGDTLKSALDIHLRGDKSVDLEEAMEITRRLVGEARFMIASRLATNQIDALEAGRDFTQIAYDAIAALEPAAQRAMVSQFGEIEGEYCVIGFGRLGSNRMTLASDIDIVFVYDTPVSAQSSGPRVIDGVTWYTRKVRRMVTALSADTKEGGLYEVDMQLRPSGGAGPAAVKLSAFENYYGSDAWIWELMALTKAKVVAGEEGLCKKVQSIISDTLLEKRDKAEIASGVLEMRGRLLSTKPAKSIWERKSVHGGLTDIEFITQYLYLVYSHEIGLPPLAVAQDNNLQFYVEHSKISQKQADFLLSAFQLNERILHLARLGSDDEFNPQVFGKKLSEKLYATCGAREQEEAESILGEYDSQVRDIFSELVG